MDLWLTPALAFAGGLVGAGIPAWVALRGQRHDKRVEWRQRFDQAVAHALSDRPGERAAGELLLVDLMRSDLGSRADRDLARQMGAVIVDVDADGGHNGGQEVQA